MPLIMSYDQWMKDTYSLTKPRSEELKKIDHFIKARNERETLKALTVWIDTQNKKGQDWHRSIRNQKGKAVERLAKEVGYLAAGGTTMTAAEKMADAAAKEVIRKHILSASVQMFAGKNVIMSNLFLQKVANRTRRGKEILEDKKYKALHDDNYVGKHKATHAGQDLRKAGTNANSIRLIAKELEQALNDIVIDFPEIDKRQIFDLAFGVALPDFALSCAPIIGTIISGGKTAMNVIRMMMADYATIQFRDNFGDVRPGDAAAALAAIIRILEGEVARNQKEAAIHGAAFTAKAAMLCAGVPVESLVGATEGMLMLVHNLYEVAKQYRQMKDANDKIRAGNIDISIFNSCPILGCYYILVQGDFTIMNFDVSNMGKQNWAQEVLRLKLALEPIKQKAGFLVANSSIVIEGMANAQGIYQETLWRKITQPIKDRVKSHKSRPASAPGQPDFSGMGGFTKADYEMPGVDVGRYSEKELMFLKMFEPA